jgi:hypothetical protein
MSNKNPFRNNEFNDKLISTKNKIEDYLNEKKFKLTEITIDELVQWNDVSANGPRLIYPHEKCPDEIKNIVQQFINDEFKSNK